MNFRKVGRMLETPESIPDNRAQVDPIIRIRKNNSVVIKCHSKHFYLQSSAEMIIEKRRKAKILGLELNPVDERAPVSVTKVKPQKRKVVQKPSLNPNPVFKIISTVDPYSSSHHQSSEEMNNKKQRKTEILREKLQIYPRKPAQPVKVDHQGSNVEGISAALLLAIDPTPEPERICSGSKKSEIANQNYDFDVQVHQDSEQMEIKMEHKSNDDDDLSACFEFSGNSGCVIRGGGTCESNVQSLDHCHATKLLSDECCNSESKFDGISGPKSILANQYYCNSDDYGRGTSESNIQSLNHCHATKLLSDECCNSESKLDGISGPKSIMANQYYCNSDDKQILELNSSKSVTNVFCDPYLAGSSSASASELKSNISDEVKKHATTEPKNTPKLLEMVNAQEQQSTHTSSFIQCYICQQQIKRSQDNHQWKSHVKSHVQLALCCWYCLICDIQFHQPTSFHVHIQHRHAAHLQCGKEGKTQYICKLCPKFYGKSGSLMGFRIGNKLIQIPSFHGLAFHMITQHWKNREQLQPGAMWTEACNHNHTRKCRKIVGNCGAEKFLNAARFGIFSP